MKRKLKGNFITIKQVVEDFTKQESAQKIFDRLNNEIKFREPNTESAYDGSRLNRLDN